MSNQEKLMPYEKIIKDFPFLDKLSKDDLLNLLMKILEMILKGPEGDKGFIAAVHSLIHHKRSQ